MTYEPTTAEYVRAATEASFSEHELNPSMRDFANRIAYDACAKLRAKLQAEGWRQCAKGQGTSQFCGQLEEAVKAERKKQSTSRLGSLYILLGEPDGPLSGGCCELGDWAAGEIERLRAALPDLQPVIARLENGCDVAQAVKELRIYDEAIRARSKQ